MIINNRIRLISFLTFGFLLVHLSSCRRDDNGTPQISYPIGSTALTTLDRTVIPVAVPYTTDVVYPSDLSKYAQYGYGVWQYGPGVAYHQDTSLMPLSYSSASVTVKTELLRFFTMSDIHLTDKESPAQQIEFGYKGGPGQNNGNSSAYSGVILYTTHVLDAAIQTINALNKVNKFDFGMGLGDAVNNAQYNELRWYIDIFDGQKITPDSGKKDDPISGPDNDYQDEFQSAGLSSDVPWYQVLGNHDHFCTGMFTPDAYVWKTYTGENIMNMGNIMDATSGGIKSRGYYMGVVDGTSRWGNIIGAGPVSDYSIPPTVVADANRHYINKRSWMNEFFNTTSKPVGHGFTQENLDRDFACYSFVPKSDLPLKVIVFDDTQREDRVDMKEQGFVTRDRFDWLIDELEAGQQAGQLMIISAHIPLYAIDKDNDSPISLQTMYTMLHKYSNLLLWISGHVHENKITPEKSLDPAHPEFGFWHVETASLRDFPQQFRTFRIVSNSDSTISIFATDVDPAVKDGSPAAISRSYAIGAMEIFQTEGNIPTPSGVSNSELVKLLSPGMRKKIMQYKPTTAR